MNNQKQYNDLFVTNIPHINGDNKATEADLFHLIQGEIDRNRLNWGPFGVKINAFPVQVATVVAYVWFENNAIHPTVVQYLDGYRWTQEDKVYALKVRLNPKPTPDHLRREITVPVRVQERVETLRRAEANWIATKEQEWQERLERIEIEKDHQISLLQAKVSVCQDEEETKRKDDEEKHQLIEALTLKHENELSKVRVQLDNCNEELIEVRRRYENEKGERKDAKKQLRLERLVWNNEKSEFEKKIARLEKVISSMTK